MTRHPFLLIGLLLFTMSAHAQSTPDTTGTLVIVMDGFDTDAGTARVRLDASAAAYDRDEAGPHAAALPITGGTAVWTVDALPWGRYAARAFHDEDGDGSLDTNLFGVPSEPFGFSNDASARFGRPDFDAAAFRFAASRDTVRLHIE
jgi:uncharacterized protein (DUF2141 family)